MFLENPRFKNKVKQVMKADMFKAPQSMLKEEPMTTEWQEQIIDWVTFYRRNIHRFVEHYFGIELYDYQKLWIYYLSTRDKFITVGARAGAKSWLIALYALARGVLYPNSEIVIVATTKKQAGIIFGKMDRMIADNLNIAREIKDFVNAENRWKCVMHSGTTIKVVACNEGGRGERSTCTIAEEFRIMNKEKYDSIVRPFAVKRQPRFIKNPDYSDYEEDFKEIMISSAYHKSEWWYAETMKAAKQMVEGHNVGVFFFDLLIAVKHNIKSWKIIASDKSGMDAITFMEEYENIPWGENNKAYFKLSMFSQCQKLKQAFYPKTNDDIFNKKYKPEIAKRDDEIRILSVDIATRKGHQNDNTIISCIRLLPGQKGYDRELVYMESFNGENTLLQALRIKQLFYDFEADNVILDLQQAGIAVYDALTQITKDPDRGVEYDPWLVMMHPEIDQKLYDELIERAIAKEGLEVIFPILATAQLNNDIAVAFRDRLQKRNWNFLVPPIEADEYLTKKEKNYLKDVDGINQRVRLLHPYAQTTEFINECISLEANISGGKIQLKEREGKRKDRYTSVSYGNYYITFLDRDLIKDNKPKNPLRFLTQYIYN